MAILWDYDGTLVDSSRKNMEVTISIFRKFYPDIAAKVMTVSPYYEPQGAIKERVEARLLTKPHRII